jgi:hypothetical protein
MPQKIPLLTFFYPTVRETRVKESSGKQIEALDRACFEIVRGMRDREESSWCPIRSHLLLSADCLAIGTRITSQEKLNSQESINIAYLTTKFLIFPPRCNPLIFCTKNTVTYS